MSSKRNPTFSVIEHSVNYFGSAPVQLSHTQDNQDLYVRETERSNEETVIDQLEVAQLNGTLERDIRKLQQTILRISEYGVQIMASDKKRTLKRVPLLNVLFTVGYDDGFGRYNCAIVVKSKSESGHCEAHVFQAEGRSHADRIILDMDNLFKQMKRAWVLAASATALTLSTGKLDYQGLQESHKNGLDRRIQKASELIKRHMVVNGIPGLSIGVSVDGNKIWSQGFGYANLETGALCTEDSVMRIASISKPITATIAALLVQDGKLDLNKAINEYIPEFPHKKINGTPVVITTRQLLSHTGGIRHYQKKNEDIDLEDSTSTAAKEFLSNINYGTVTDALQMFKDDPLVCEPGKSFNYTTHGFTLVSAVLEKVAEKDFTKLIRELCFQLELRNTHLDVNKKIIPHRVSYYVRQNGVLENCQEVDNSYKWAGGGLLSNISDLLCFANCYLRSYQKVDEKILKNSTLMELWKGEIPTGKDSTTKAALGWMRVDGLNGRGSTSSNSLWYHTGAAVGASSVLLIRPTSQKIANSDASAADIESIFHDYQAA